MSEPAGQLAPPYGAHPVPPPPGRSPWLVVPLQVVLIVALLAGAGLLCGVIWEWWWTAPRGVVQDHVWYPGDEKALRGQFSGTGMFVVVGVVGGVVMGGLTSWLLARAELATVLAVAGGSLLAAYLMMRLGVHLGPPDEQALAASAADGTRLPEHLDISGGLAPYLAFPLGALAITGLIMFVPRGPSD